MQSIINQDMVKNMPIFIINPQNIYIIRYMTTPDLSIEKRLHTHTIQVNTVIKMVTQTHISMQLIKMLGLV